MYNHDPVKYCRYLKQALSQEKSHIGFFIAAGCPLAVEMPTGEHPLIPDVAGLTKYVGEKLISIKTLKYEKLINEITKSGINDATIEDILSFVRTLKDVSKGGEVRGFSDKDLENIEKSICITISEKIRVKLPNLDTPYHRIANWINSVERIKPLEIFTTNYDLLIEQALEDSSVSYFDGFIGSRNSFFDLRTVEEDKLPNHWARLWKLHGSLNWHIKEDGCITRSTGEKSNWDNHLIYPSHLKYSETRKMPFLALIDRLSKFISNKGSVLIISGYSFNDNHLNDCIFKALKSNPSSVAFCLLFGKLDSYPKAKLLAQKCPNLSLMALDKGLIGTAEGAWESIQDHSEIERSIKFLIKKTSQNSVELSLGDFNQFSLFLKYLISEELGAVNGK